jgi:hypothetical protein
VTKNDSVKIEDTDSLQEEQQEEEITHKTAVRAILILSVVVIAGLLIMFALEKYNNYHVTSQIRAYLDDVNSIIGSETPQSVFVVENIEFDLTRFRDDNMDDRTITEEINNTLHHIQDLPVYVHTGNQIRSWSTSDIVRTELDSLIVPYKDRNNYSIKTVYRPVSPLEVRAFELQKAHPDWTKDDCLRIAGKKLWAGMSKVQLQASWGNPRSIDKNYTFGSNSEQWVYGSMGPYVYIENGIVTSWQE